MKITKREQLFLDKLEKEGLVWNFDYILLETKNKKGQDKIITYKSWNIAYDLIEKGLIKVNLKTHQVGLKLKSMEKVLYIVRGIPGSGKSTFAKHLTANVFEADHYFYDNDGNYNFIPSEIKNAHKECQEFVRYAMESGIEKIAVSNTSTQEWEMKVYQDLAETYGYMVFSVIVENRHGGVNQHNVPEEKIEQMKTRFEIRL